MNLKDTINKHLEQQHKEHNTRYLLICTLVERKAGLNDFNKEAYVDMHYKVFDKNLNRTTHNRSFAYIRGHKIGFSIGGSFDNWETIVKEYYHNRMHHYNYENKPMETWFKKEQQIKEED